MQNERPESGFFSKLTLMGFSTLFRMLNSAILLIIIARYLGVEQFGALAFFQSICFILILIVEFGFTNQLLKDISEKKNKVNALVSEAFVIKSFLAIPFIIIIATFDYFYNKELESSYILFFIAASTLFTSFGDFFNIPHRALNNYGKETLIVFLSTVVVFVTVYLVLKEYASLYAVVLALTFSRLFYCLISYYSFITNSGKIKFDFKFGYLLSRINRNKYFAFDVWIVGLRRHSDVILVNTFFDPSVVGIYQAGMNLCKIERFGPVVANVFLPKLSYQKASEDIVGFNQSNRVLNIILNSTGLSIFIVLFFYSNEIVDLIYGDAYKSLSNLLPYFGVFIVVRFYTISKEVVITAKGLQKNKTQIGFFTFCVFITLAFIFTPYLNLYGLLISHIAAGIFLACFLNLSNNKNKLA